MEWHLQPAEGFKFTAQTKKNTWPRTVQRGKKKGKKEKKRGHSTSYRFYLGEIYFKLGLWQINLLDAAMYCESFKASLAYLGAWD